MWSFERFSIDAKERVIAKLEVNLNMLLVSSVLLRNVQDFLKYCHQGIQYPLKLTIIPCLKEFRITQCAEQKLQGSHNVRKQLHSKNEIEYE